MFLGLVHVSNRSKQCLDLTYKKNNHPYISWMVGTVLEEGKAIYQSICAPTLTSGHEL